MVSLFVFYKLMQWRFADKKTQILEDKKIMK